MKTVLFYKRERCPLCDEAMVLLQMFQQEYNFQIKEIDIYSDDSLLEKYQLSIPVIELEGDQLDGSQMNYIEMSQFFERKY